MIDGLIIPGLTTQQTAVLRRFRQIPILPVIIFRGPLFLTLFSTVRTEHLVTPFLGLPNYANLLGYFVLSQFTGRPLF
jgi:hypothetical protein